MSSSSDQCIVNSSFVKDYKFSRQWYLCAQIFLKKQAEMREVSIDPLIPILNLLLSFTNR